MRANTERNIPLLRSSLTWMKGVTVVSCLDRKCHRFLALRRRFIQTARKTIASMKISPTAPNTPATAALLFRKDLACGAFTDCDDPEVGCTDENEVLDDHSVADETRVVTGSVDVIPP